MGEKKEGRKKVCFPKSRSFCKEGRGPLERGGKEEACSLGGGGGEERERGPCVLHFRGHVPVTRTGGETDLKEKPFRFPKKKSRESSSLQDRHFADLPEWRGEGARLRVNASCQGAKSSMIRVLKS